MRPTPQSRWLVPVVLFASVLCLGPAATLSATDIIYEGPASEAVKDLREALGGYEAGEIRLERVERGDGRTGQAFFLERSGGRTLIRYTTANSLENAVYTLLDHWGFRWYGPGEDWFVKPAAVPADDIAGGWVAPTFRNRSFFGTGGLDVPPPNDPENRYKAGWYAWKRRNRFNADFAATGHTGEAFYLENKELLDAHPEWFNGEQGKRLPSVSSISAQRPNGMSTGSCAKATR